MKKIIISLAILALSGCAQQTFHINGTTDAAPKKNEMQQFFVSGIGQKQELDAAAICGGAKKVVKVEVQQEAIDCLLGVVTFGIYTPRHARVYCRR